MPIHRTSKSRERQKQRNRQIVTLAKWVAVLLSVVLLATTAAIVTRAPRGPARESGTMPVTLQMKVVRPAR